MRRIDDPTTSSRAPPTETTASTIAGGQAYLAEVARRLAGYCARAQARERVLAYRRGVRSEAERKHRWPVAAVCGESTPYGFQSVLSRADGEAEAVRAELCLSVLQPLGDATGVLVLAATGLLTTGEHSAGVARQDRGTAGTVEHCQIGGLLSEASSLGHALLDREP